MNRKHLIYPLLLIGGLACLSACSVPGWHHSIPSPTVTRGTVTPSHPRTVRPPARPVTPGELVTSFRADGLSPSIKVDGSGNPYVVADLDGTLWTCYSGTGLTIGATGAVREHGWTCSTDSLSPAEVLGFSALTNGRIVRG